MTKPKKNDYAPSEDSDQPGPPRSLIRDSIFLHADSEDSDLTGQMPRRIWVLAGRTVILLVLSWGGQDDVPFCQHELVKYLNLQKLLLRATLCIV